MRRAEREVTDIDEKLGIIARCKVCRLGMIDETAGALEPYIVPLNFGWEYKDDALLLYFHSAGEGRKITILKDSALSPGRPVCFEMDGGHQLVSGPKDCNYTFYFESVIGKGTVEFLDDRADKVHGLSLMMRQQTGEDRDFAFDDKAINATTLFRLRVSAWSAKRHTA
jgi:nitroimidazol reductase NimA-like FMN-containing flavoprotein (pyridoxamine 5'-phosphate oxidase superfamily)